MIRSVRSRRLRAGLALALLGAAIAGAPAGAQPSGGEILTASPDSALAVALETLPGEPLVLAEVLEAALGEASVARIAAAQMDAAAGLARRERGAFDPELFGRAEWSGADTPQTSPFAGTDILQTETSVLEAGARMRLNLGTEISASLQSQRFTSNSAYTALAPEYRATGALTLRQPLLKGFGPAARADLLAADRGLEGAANRLVGARLAVQAEAEAAYWQLYAAERNHAVSVLVRDRAAAFLADTRLRAEAGLVGPSQVANAEYFLAEAEQAALDTSELLDAASDRLASLIGRRPSGDRSRFRPHDDPPRDFPVLPQETLLAAAFAHNPDLLALESDLKAMNAREAAARWDARPTLDLVGGLGGGGLAGTAQDIYFFGSEDPVQTQWGGPRSESLKQVFRRDFPTWNVGMVFSLPLGGREGGGEHDRLQAEVVRMQEMVVSARRLLEEQVRAQQRELARGNERLELATAGVEASYKQVEIGMIEFRNGRSTAFEVVRLAADLATAQQRYSAALVRTARAAAILRQLTGGRYPTTMEQEN
ncbi:MAG: TolC family protein [Candidatus Krumholzibacteriia bacterium]